MDEMVFVPNSYHSTLCGQNGIVTNSDHNPLWTKKFSSLIMISQPFMDEIVFVSNSN